MGTLLSRHVGYEVSVDTIIEHPKLSELIPAIESIAEAPGADSNPTDQGQMPITPPQRRFLERASVAPSHFNVARIVESSEAIDNATWETAIAGLIRHYDALRIRFSTTDDAAMQILETDGSNTVLLGQTKLGPEEDYRCLLPDLQRQLDIVNGPLAVFHRFELPNGTEKILICLHHLIADRLSLLSLIDELDHRLCNEDSRNPATGYATWTAQIQKFAHSEEAVKLTALWDQKVVDPAEEFTLPGADVVPLNRHTNSVSFELDSGASEVLLRPRGDNPQIQEVLIAAVGEGLRRCWGQGKCFVGIDVLGSWKATLCRS